MRKTIYTLLFIFSFLLAIPCISEAKTTSSNWYKKVLDSTSATFVIGKKRYYRSNYYYYKTLDINKDGCKELILSTTSDNYLTYEDSALLLAWNRGKVRAVKEFSNDGGGSIGYSSKKKQLCFFKRTSTDSSYTSYNLKGGKLKKADKTSYVRKSFNKSPYYKYIYKVNGKKVSQKRWNSYSKKIYGKGLDYNYIAR